MKTVAIFILSAYKVVLSPLLHQLLGVKSACRYQITCSEYAKNVILKEGIGKGSVLTVRRLLSCQPFIPYGKLI